MNEGIVLPRFVESQNVCVHCPYLSPDGMDQAARRPARKPESSVDVDEASRINMHAREKIHPQTLIKGDHINSRSCPGQDPSVASLLCLMPHAIACCGDGSSARVCKMPLRNIIERETGHPADSESFPSKVHFNVTSVYWGPRPYIRDAR